MAAAVAGARGVLGGDEQEGEEEEGEEGSASLGGHGGLQVERKGGVTTITVTPSGDDSTGVTRLRPGGGSSSGYLKLTQQGAESADDASASVLQQLRPRGLWEWRVVAAVGAVRFVIMPLVSAAIVLGAAASGLLPRDAPVLLSLMLQGAMPPAQALVVMLQLKPGPGGERGEGAGGRGGLAGAAARVVLQMYAVAALPMTIWASWFSAAAGVAAAW